MPGRKEIVSGYSQAAQNDIRRQETIERINEQRAEEGKEPLPYHPLTPAEYMLRTLRGPHEVKYRGKTYYSQYSSADSASRAFRKLRSGEITGEKVYAKSEQYAYQEKTGGYSLGAGKGGRQEGLWLAYVNYVYTDQDGVEHGPVTKSFVVLDKHDRFHSQFETAIMEQELDSAIEGKMSEWTANGSDASEDYEVISVDIVRIQTTSKTMQYIVAV